MSERFFLDSPVVQNRATLRGPEAQHLGRVMRAKPGDEATLFDGIGAEYQARIAAVGRDQVELEIIARQEINRELPITLHLAVALPKGERQRWLVEKLVELGVTRLTPLVTRRVVAQPRAQAIERLGRSVIEASKQCGRNRLMEITPACDWSDFVQLPGENVPRFVAHPSGVTGEQSLSQLRQDWPAQEVRCAVGPEGGFADEEIAAAVACGWRTVSLGPRILRVETAAIALAGWFALLR